MTDLTTGSPTKQMLKFAMPVCLGNLFQLFYSLTDTRIVGSTLGENALAAVGASTAISTLLIGFLTGLTNGFSIIILLSLSFSHIAFTNIAAFNEDPDAVIIISSISKTSLS